MFEKIKDAYKLGKEHFFVAGDLFWCKHKTDSEGNRIYPTDDWFKRRDELQERRGNMTRLEKLAFDLGEFRLEMSGYDGEQTTPYQGTPIYAKLVG